MKEVW